MANLFISHSWKYGDQYSQLKTLLENRGYEFRDYSIPETNPIYGANTDKQLEQAIEQKMKLCSIVLIMAGVYASHSKWINKEIEIAKRLGKPIIAVKPYGADRISVPVRNACDEECGWNSLSIVNAINRLI